MREAGAEGDAAVVAARGEAQDPLLLAAHRDAADETAQPEDGIPLEDLIPRIGPALFELGSAYISSTDLVVRFVEQSSEKAKGVHLSANEWRVFARINGKQTLAEIAQKTGLGEFDVCRIVYGFLTAGLVELQKRPRPASANERPSQEPPKVKKSLVSRIINRIRNM